MTIWQWLLKTKEYTVKKLLVYIIKCMFISIILIHVLVKAYEMMVRPKISGFWM